MIQNHFFSSEDLLQILELGRLLHLESKYKDTPYNEDRCLTVLHNTQKNPKMFLAYDDQFRGFIIMQATNHYWNGDLWTADLAFYVKPEFRGVTKVAAQLLKAAEEWSKSIGAREMTIFHNTNINMEKAPKFFNRVGYDTAGYIFTKGLQ